MRVGHHHVLIPRRLAHAFLVKRQHSPVVLPTKTVKQVQQVSKQFIHDGAGLLCATGTSTQYKYCFCSPQHVVLQCHLPVKRKRPRAS